MNFAHVVKRFITLGIIPILRSLAINRNNSVSSVVTWLLRRILRTFRCFLRHSAGSTILAALCFLKHSGSTSLLPHPTGKKQRETESFGATLSASDASPLR